MLFNSDVFLFVFLPVVFAGFCIVRQFGNRTAIVLWLFVSSLFFYGWWNPQYVGLILASICFNFCLGHFLRGQGTESKTVRKLILALGIAGNLGLIGYFKYAGFLVFNANALFGTEFDVGTIILPLAISFFTFQQISYLVDAYEDQTEDHRFFDYCLYVTFFPQLIAGPIVFHREVMPQYKEGAFFSGHAENLAIGLSVFIIGLCKKVLIADSLSVHVEPVFAAASAGEAIDLTAAWIGSLAYTFQLYFDFSGYSDMAVGLGRMFGIRLPLNFNSPYKAGSIVDFWKRWHMTLSRFLREYLYFPLGGNRKGRLRRYVNLITTMGLGGLWHGAAWTFVIWGLIHGACLVINHGWRVVLRRLGIEAITRLRFYRTAAWMLTFVTVVVGWVVFRAETLDGAGSILVGMFGMNGLPEAVSADLGAVMLIVFAAVIAFAAPNTQEWIGIQPPDSSLQLAVSLSLNPLLRWRANGILAGGFGIALFAAVYFLRGTSEFLYFQF